MSEKILVPIMDAMLYRKSTDHKNNISRQISPIKGTSRWRGSSSPAPSLAADSSSHDVDKEYSVPTHSTGNSVKIISLGNADRIVIRAYKAIVNIINLRWSLTELPSQVSLLATTKNNQFDNPGARLFALRSKLRNEQHMAIAIDRVAAVLLVDMRDDLGESYKGTREKGFRTAIAGNKLLADQWNKSHKEVTEEIRAGITYNFAEQIISPGINLLLGSRSQDV